MLIKTSPTIILMHRQHYKLVNYGCSGCTVLQEIKYIFSLRQICIQHNPVRFRFINLKLHVKNFKYIMNQFLSKFTKPYFRGTFLRIWATLPSIGWVEYKIWLLHFHSNPAGNSVVLVSLLLTLTIFHTLSIVNFEQVNAG